MKIYFFFLAKNDFSCGHIELFGNIIVINTYIEKKNNSGIINQKFV